MPAHRFLIDDQPLTAGTEIEVVGDEAHHAGVKRLRAGQPVEALDGRGTVAEGRFMRATRGHRPTVVIALDCVRTDPPVEPRIEVYAPCPRGSHLETMIDQLGQVGAAAWFPLLADHRSGDAAPARRDRLARIVLETAKQCGRSWPLELGDPIALDDVLALPGGTTLLADASGGPAPESGASPVRVLIGPEGGWSGRELEAAARLPRLRLGPHTMRLETAAVVAAARFIAPAAI